MDPGSFYRILISNLDEHRDAAVNAWFFNELAPYASNLFRTKIHRTTHLKKSRTACQPMSVYVESYGVRDDTALRAVKDYKVLANEIHEYYEQKASI